MDILFAWIGTQDLNAARESADPGVGPIANALTSRAFDTAVLLANQGDDALNAYIEWLAPQTSAALDGRLVDLNNPTDFRKIYQIAGDAIRSALDEYAEENPELTFHVSPGTSQMAAVWILMRAQFPAQLIQTSIEAGLELIDIPFEISAELVSQELAPKDEELTRMVGLFNANPIDSFDYQSEVMVRLLGKAVKASKRAVPVFIEGEPGTEKRELAQAIHKGGPRCDAAFIHVDCAAFDVADLEPRIFGESGDNSRSAWLCAENGTLYLESVELLPPTLQARLLTALTHTTPKSPRMIVSSRVNLHAATTEGQFREDLFYSLAVVLLKIPPLRERTGDLGGIIETVLARVNEEAQDEPGFKPRQLSPAARDLLMRQAWPGNMYELLNTLRRTVVWSDSERIGEDAVWDALLSVTGRINSADTILGLPIEDGVDIQKKVAEVVMHYIDRVREYTAGNKSRTAKLLGLSSYQTLENWERKYSGLLQNQDVVNKEEKLG